MFSLGHLIIIIEMCIHVCTVSQKRERTSPKHFNLQFVTEKKQTEIAHLYGN